LAGATATVSTAVAVAVSAWIAIADGATALGLLLAALSSAFLASAVAVLRMRAWGVVVAGIGAVAALATAALLPNDRLELAIARIPILFAAVPLSLVLMLLAPHAVRALRDRFGSAARLEGSEGTWDTASAPIERQRIDTVGEVAGGEPLKDDAEEIGPEPKRAVLTRS
jgi:hypothetical protein